MSTPDKQATWISKHILFRGSLIVVTNLGEGMFLYECEDGSAHDTENEARHHINDLINRGEA